MVGTVSASKKPQPKVQDESAEQETSVSKEAFEYAYSQVELKMFDLLLNDYIRMSMLSNGLADLRLFALNLRKKYEFSNKMWETPQQPKQE